MQSVTIGGEPPGRKVTRTSSYGANNSPGLDSKSVVYSYSQTLLVANIAFCGLHRDMPEKKLYLLESPRIMAEPRTGPLEIMSLETWNVNARNSLFDNVPGRLTAD
jgi:hypothetical protein